ncbi:MAG: CIA30 family protein [Kangiellaceae bacterium]
MKLCKTIALISSKTFFLIGMLTFSNSNIAENLKSIVDDFSDPLNNSIGIPRQFLNDSVAGGKTTTEQTISNGVIYLKGEITPPRGQPGWASTILLLEPKGLPQDASAFEGISLFIKVNSGNVSLSANSSEVTNFDYHAALVSVASDGKFHEVKIPFASMKRGWSEQTQLNTKTISSLSIVAYGLQKTSFDFEVDKISFY